MRLFLAKQKVELLHLFPHLLGGEEDVNKPCDLGRQSVQYVTKCSRVPHSQQPGGAPGLSEQLPKWEMNITVISH